MQDITEAIRLANIIINNQQVTGKRFNEIETEIKKNQRLLNTVISNQDAINRNVQSLMNQVNQLKKDN